MRFTFIFLLCATPALAEFTNAQIVVLGEIHDNASSHQAQADALLSLGAKAVVFEMLSPEDAAIINADRSQAETIWKDTNWPDYALYAPIFDAIGPASIIGAAAQRSTVMKVRQNGSAHVFGDESKRFGLTTPLPKAEQSAREQLQFDAHCQAMPREMMAGMVEIQRFRDARFAEAALAALDRHGQPVAVIAGAGHARTDWGIPAAVARAAPDVTVYAAAFIENAPDAPYDSVTLVPEAQRDDPCATFKKN